ncbi:MAG: hypothetical protein MGG11_15025 [Trichodesmium sp. MAG_R03]|nr:hypothetical protein [Trichodesmium sp. MAG_R03]
MNQLLGSGKYFLLTVIDPQGFVALSRYETEGDKHILHENPHWSQDVWAVLGEYNFTEYFKNDLRIPLGVPGCDHKIGKSKPPKNIFPDFG